MRLPEKALHFVKDGRLERSGSSAKPFLFSYSSVTLLFIDWSDG